ncbi:hypothetical protein [Ralstonia pickettii]|uniref:hypothetical protein n=1 Tax=Ralstonia pickettii TaxID=329 RepID=UPI001112911F|nr:hypothetical protein [Ralstonia pickettii]
MVQTTVKTKNGKIEIRTARRADKRWESDYRLIPTSGSASRWSSAAMPEGFLTSGLALTAGIFLGHLRAEELSGHEAIGG